MSNTAAAASSSDGTELITVTDTEGEIDLMVIFPSSTTTHLIVGNVVICKVLKVRKAVKDYYNTLPYHAKMFAYRRFFLKKNIDEFTYTFVFHFNLAYYKAGNASETDPTTAEPGALVKEDDYIKALFASCTCDNFRIVSSVVLEN